MNGRGFVYMFGRRVTAIALFVVACSASVTPPPSNLDDACVIAHERPKWLKAMQNAQAKWNVPIHVQMAFIYQESKFRGDARTPLRYELGVIPMGRQSSAYGYAQAIDSTWKWYLRETGNRGAKRDDIDDATDFMGWYMNQTLERNGVKLSDAKNQYLAYHDGHTGYAKRSYRRKRWLVRISDEIKVRSEMYETQLADCIG